MPWEKSFDLDETTDRAMRVFWSKGYEATSISDLTKGMGINKGSLYNAFGSKKALFDRAFLKYDRENRRATLMQLSEVEDTMEAVRMLFDGLIDETRADQDRKGCFLVNTALDLPNHDPDVRAMVTSALGDFETFFEKLIIRGQQQQQIPGDIDPKSKAKVLLSLVVALRVLARGVFEADDLIAIRNEALSSLGQKT